MKLSTVTGHHLVAAYQEMFPGELTDEDVELFQGRFLLWLDSLREGNIEHQLALNARSFTGKRTLALLAVLDLDPPHNLRELVMRLELTSLALRYRLKQRANHINRLEPPQK